MMSDAAKIATNNSKKTLPENTGQRIPLLRCHMLINDILSPTAIAGRIGKRLISITKTIAETTKPKNSTNAVVSRLRSTFSVKNNNPISPKTTTPKPSQKLSNVRI